MALQPSFFKGKMSERVNHRTRQEPRPPPPDFGREEKRILRMFMTGDASPQQPHGLQLPPVDPSKIKDVLVRAAVAGHTLSFSPDDEESGSKDSVAPKGDSGIRSNTQGVLDAASPKKLGPFGWLKDREESRHSPDD